MNARDRCVVINHKTTKFESNSQPLQHIEDIDTWCYQSQNYKIWKQFTTTSLVKNSITSLLSIIKLQNLKAIHNGHRCQGWALYVVINHKTTKFESNSQPVSNSGRVSFCCYQSQYYKIWKQLTTDKSSSIWAYKLLSITKLQNMKAIHNVWF